MSMIFRKYWKHLAFTAAGAVLGFMYWRFIGCQSGSCPITANWHTSVVLGGLIGFLAVPAPKKEKQSKDISYEKE